jgi:hypothetical protein
MTTPEYLREVFVFNALQNEVASALRAVQNGDKDKCDYLAAGREVLNDWKATKQYEEGVRE